MKSWFPATALSLAAHLSGGCAVLGSSSLPAVPPELMPPATQVVFLEANASGMQVYECTTRPANPAAFQWTQRAAEAWLVDASGRPAGKHYYPGPTWEAVDGSKVITEVKARRPSPDPSAVPWLLLASKSHSGQGTFSQTRSIQRVRTSGGVAPAATCGASNAGQVTRVPYTATFYFYREGP